MKSSFRYFLWGLVGAVIFLAVILLVLHFQPTSVAAQVESRARREEDVNQMRFHLASATEAEKSAVLATTDKDSQVFADQARAETATVESLRADFEALAQTGKERTCSQNSQRPSPSSSRSTRSSWTSPSRIRT